MKTIECNECGEPITAADTEELVRNLAGHLKTEHGVETDEEDLTELVESEAYEAMDS